MEKVIAVTRVYEAPVASVWKIWTDPELVKRWWGPDRFTCPNARIDFRVGGISLVSMKAAKELGGQEWFSVWRYTIIVPGKHIEFIQNLADGDGNIVAPVQVGMPADFPTDIRTVVTFRDIGGEKTEMTVSEYADMGQTTRFAQIGLEQSMDKIAAIFAASNAKN